MDYPPGQHHPHYQHVAVVHRVAVVDPWQPQPPPQRQLLWQPQPQQWQHSRRSRSRSRLPPLESIFKRRHRHSTAATNTESRLQTGLFLRLIHCRRHGQDKHLRHFILLI